MTKISRVHTIKNFNIYNALWKIDLCFLFWYLISCLSHFAPGRVKAAYLIWCTLDTRYKDTKFYLIMRNVKSNKCNSKLSLGAFLLLTSIYVAICVKVALPCHFYYYMYLYSYYFLLLPFLRTTTFISIPFLPRTTISATTFYLSLFYCYHFYY